MNPEKIRGKKQPSKNSTDLFVKMIKENKDFEDLCDERNKIVRIIEHQQIVTEALFTELEKWDQKVDSMFQKELEKSSSFEKDQNVKSKRRREK